MHGTGTVSCLTLEAVNAYDYWKDCFNSHNHSRAGTCWEQTSQVVYNLESNKTSYIIYD